MLDEAFMFIGIILGVIVYVFFLFLSHFILNPLYP